MSAIDLIRVPAQPADPQAPERGGRRSWSWLLLGALLLPFMIFQNVIPAAAWLAAVFLLRFTRTQRARVALPVIALVGYVATLISLRGFFLRPPEVFLFALGGALIVLPYAADTLAGRRLRGLARTLVFPAVDTAVAFLVTADQGSALGSWGATGYTQVSNLALSQSVSVVGMWGLAFVIMWTAPVVNELWEHGFDLRAARAAVGPFVVVLLAMSLFGGARLAFAAPPDATVPVAALAPDRERNAARAAGEVGPGPRTAAERARVTAEHLAPAIDDLFARTRAAARSGAKIVAWSEAAGYVFVEDEQAFLDRASEVARQERIYLELGMIFILPTTEGTTNENRSILIGPDGEVLWDYDKSTMVPGDGNALGSAVLPVVDTPYGRLSVAICFDADFPWLVRQAGRADVDILMVPSSDIGPTEAAVHDDMAVVRAIENGVSILRPTRLGTSLAIDPMGRILGSADYFVGDDQTMLATVPTQGVRTAYAVLGDIVGWMSVAAVAVGGGTLGLSALRRRARRRAGRG